MLGPDFLSELRGEKVISADVPTFRLNFNLEDENDDEDEGYGEDEDKVTNLLMSSAEFSTSNRLLRTSRHKTGSSAIIMTTMMTMIIMTKMMSMMIMTMTIMMFDHLLSCVTFG